MPSKTDEPARPLRWTTWLAPSVPRAVFAHLVDHVAATLGRPCVLTERTDRSGPRPDEAFDGDLAFICAPTYLALRAAGRRELTVGAAPVYADPRADRRPVYFSEVLVGPACPARALADLAGMRLGFNDRGSLSGFGALRHARRSLADLRCVRTGSHLASIAALRAGTVDVICVDSVTLLLADRGLHPARPEIAGLRRLASLGPWPIQPIVARADLPTPLVVRIRAALLAAPPAPHLALLGCAAQSPTDLDAAPVLETS